MLNALGGMTSLKVLYVTNFWSGFSDVLKNPLSEPKGMPGFNLPLKKLVEEGVQVDFVIVSYQDQSIDNAVPWLQTAKMHFFNGLGFKNLYRLHNIIASNGYDFVYGHGCKPAFWANVFSNIYKIPCGVRLYGTFMITVIQENIFSAFVKHPYEFAIYNLPKKFLLVTDDGTKGDEVCSRFNLLNSSYDFHFWVNGIDVKYPEASFQPNEDFHAPFLFCPARFDRWKRQDMAIDIVKVLKSRGVIIQLVLCGHYFDKTYVSDLTKKIEENEVGELVTLQESMPKNDLYRRMVEATAMLFCYDFSNFGNVLIEACSLGALSIVRNDGSCDRVIINGETGILFDSIEQAADSIQAVINDQICSTSIRRDCKKLAAEIFMSWDQRILSEINLVLVARGERGD